MRHRIVSLTLSSAALVAGCTVDSVTQRSAVISAAANAQPTPPLAERRPYTVRSPNGDRVDEYYWLRDDTRTDPNVIAYLNAEHAYKTAMMAHTEPLQQRLYEEMVARIPQEDSTVPYRKHGYWYYTRFAKGQEHPIYARRRGDMSAPEEVLLDVNEMAKGHAFFRIANYEVTRDGRRLAYAVDTVGRRQYTLRVKDLASGKELADEARNAERDLAWTADGSAFLWVEKDPQTLLGFRVRKHVIGTDAAADAVLYEEKDPAFYIDVFAGRSGRFIYIVSELIATTLEWRYADAADPKLDFKVIVPRERDHEHYVEDLGEQFVIHTNFGAKNKRVVTVPIARAADRGAWRDAIAHREDAYVQRALAFRDFLAVEERSGGLRKVRIRHWKDGREELIAADEPSYTMSLADNPEQDVSDVRYLYTSLATPESTYALDVASGRRTLLKREAVLGDFDPARYATELLWVPARDGKRIPVSVLYRKGTPLDGTAPLLVSGYGALGFSQDPTFLSSQLSLVDRGFVCALAHIRGGQELGRAWYEDGKLLRKQNTFNDFIDATEYLVAHGYGAKHKVFARGVSAGGLLMGAVANTRPDLYSGIIALVPFVDIVTTMLDESIPLTTNEFDEWGNPKQKVYYDYILSYSPYDQVRAQRYPAMLVTTGFWDSQAQYYEAAKWVARLRRFNRGDAPILFHVDMAAGHDGKAGRFERFRETAMEYAFLLDRAGMH